MAAVFVEGEEVSQGIVICLKFYPRQYPFIEYYIVNWFSPGGAHPLARS
jgi:hypothetical protein